MRTVTRSLAAVLTVLALLATACGGDQDASSERVRSPSPSTARPGSTDPPGGAEDGDAAENRDREGRDERDGDSGDGDAGEETPHPRPEAPKGQVFPPQGTRYEYAVTGARRTLSMNTEQAYPDGTMQVWVHRSTVPNPADQSIQLNYRKDLEEDDWAMEVGIVWHKENGLQWASWKTRQGDTTYECLFTPRIRYADPPIEENDTYPTQAWTGGPTCSGTTDITVKRFDQVNDADGEPHDVWVISEETSYRMGSVTGTRTATHWLDPDLGVDVRTKLLDEGSAGGTPFRYEQTLVLAEEVRESR